MTTARHRDIVAVASDVYATYVLATYNKIKETSQKILNEFLYSAHVLYLTDEAMRFVARFKQLSGLEKKTVVIAAIRKFVDENLDRLNDAVEDVSEAVYDQYEKIYILINQGLDAYINQLYQLAPKLYQAQSKLKKLLLCQYFD